MKVLILGVGGVGGFVGAALARSYKDTYLYARNEAKRVIQTKGLRLDSKKLGNMVVHPKLVSDDVHELGKMDVIILACKGNRLEEVCHSIAPMITPSTVVIPLLNGVVLSDVLEKWLPPCIVADGTIRIFSHIVSPGYIIQEAGLCDIYFGMKDGRTVPIFYDIARILQEAGIRTTVVDDIVLQSWKKFAITGTMGAIFCYYKGDTAFVRSQVGYETVVEKAHQEVVDVAKAYGVTIPPEFIATLIQTFHTMPGTTITSLYRDLLDGKDPRDTELDILLGDLVRKGKNVGVDTPIFAKAYDNFRHQSLKK